MKQTEQPELELTDRLNWIAENLRICTKKGEIINLYPNIGQLQLHNSIELQRSKGLPVRICLLKPRRVGWSTWCEADAFCDVFNRPNISALAVSADDQATDEIFRMTKMFHDELPFKRPTEYSNRKEIIYSKPHRSRIVAMSSGKVVLGRGATFQRLHCSEVAFWRDAARQLGGLYQVVSNDPDTVIILESTANGLGGAFYDTFWGAVERLKGNREDYNGYLPIFFPWYKFPEYSQSVPSGVHYEPSGEEIELQVKFNLTIEQLYWRSLKIKELNGDDEFFRQEYPATAREAFITSGRQVFPQSWISKQRTGNGRRCLFGTAKILDVEMSLDCWTVWFLPRENHQYSLGIDTMEGRLLNTDDPRSKQDYHGLVIYDRTDNKVVAQYQGRCLQHDLAEQALMAAVLYNDAWVGIEIPNGKTVLDYFIDRGYSHLYRRETHDLQDSTIETDDYGWRTTTVTRPWLVDGLLGVIRDGGFECYSKDILGEMQTFTRDKTGKPIHLSGEHDDLLFGLMIAIQVHVRCPLDAMTYPNNYSGVKSDKRSMGLNTVGAVDDMSDILGIEDELCYTN